MPTVSNGLPTLSARAVDVVNPLQHIPFVNVLYRALVNDPITPDAQFAGGFLYGGPIGAIGAAASMILGGLFQETVSATSNAFTQNEDEPVRTAKIIDPWKFNA